MNLGKVFLDSGAHTLYTEEVLKKGMQLAFFSNAREGGFSFYETDKFWYYVDTYGKFMQAYGKYFDNYVTVDVIFNPELSWKVQRYLEDQYGLRPMPVFHWGTDLKWLKQYLKAGYQYIGIGGLGQEVTVMRYTGWADRVFAYLQAGTDPVSTHGFAMTSFELMTRYPWTSVDSSTWTVLAAYGKILVPHKRGGRYSFDDSPYIIILSDNDGKERVKKGLDFHRLRGLEKATVRGWLEEIGIPVGDKNEVGVMNSHKMRCTANLKFFLALEGWLSEKNDRIVKPRRRFGLV